MAFWVGLFQKADIIIATSPQFFTTWSAFGLSHLKRKPWIFELRDLWPESIKTVGAMTENRFYHFLERIELFLYSDSNHVIPNTDAFKSNLTNRGIEQDKIHVIPNGANLELFNPRPVNEQLKKELDIQDKMVIGYIGTHGMAHSLDFILYTALKLQEKDPDIHFLFIGDGAQKQTLLKIAENLALINVTFHDPIPKERIPEYLSVIDLSLVPLKKADTFKSVIPSKIFESSAMAKPILLGVEGQAKKIIDEFEAGLCFEPENEQDFIEKVLLLKNDQQLRERLGNNGLKLAKAYDRKKLATRMLHIISQVEGHEEPQITNFYDEEENKKPQKVAELNYQ